MYINNSINLLPYQIDGIAQATLCVFRDAPLRCGAHASGNAASGRVVHVLEGASWQQTHQS